MGQIYIKNSTASSVITNLSGSPITITGTFPINPSAPSIPPVVIGTHSGLTNPVSITVTTSVEVSIAWVIFNGPCDEYSDCTFICGTGTKTFNITQLGVDIDQDCDILFELIPKDNFCGSCVFEIEADFQCSGQNTRVITNFFGGTPPYSASSFIYSTQAAAQLNNSWIPAINSFELPVGNIPNGTYWVAARDSNNTILTRSVTTNCRIVPTPTPTPTQNNSANQICVSSAGYNKVNGTFTSTGTFNLRNQYLYTNGLEEFDITWYPSLPGGPPSQWVIFSSDEGFLYRSYDNVLTPDLVVNWSAETPSFLPSPTIILGQCPSVSPTPTPTSTSIGPTPTPTATPDPINSICITVGGEALAFPYTCFTNTIGEYNGKKTYRVLDSDCNLFLPPPLDDYYIWYSSADTRWVSTSDGVGGNFVLSYLNLSDSASTTKPIGIWTSTPFCTLACVQETNNSNLCVTPTPTPTQTTTPTPTPTLDTRVCFQYVLKLPIPNTPTKTPTPTPTKTPTPTPTSTSVVPTPTPTSTSVVPTPTATQTSSWRVGNISCTPGSITGLTINGNSVSSLSGNNFPLSLGASGTTNNPSGINYGGANTVRVGMTINTPGLGNCGVLKIIVNNSTTYEGFFVGQDFSEVTNVIINDGDFIRVEIGCFPCG